MRVGLYMLNVGTEESARHVPLLAIETTRYYVKRKPHDAVCGYALDANRLRYVGAASLGSGPGQARKPTKDELLGDVKALEDAKEAEIEAEKKAAERPPPKAKKKTKKKTKKG